MKLRKYLLAFFAMLIMFSYTSCDSATFNDKSSGTENSYTDSDNINEAEKLQTEGYETKADTDKYSPEMTFVPERTESPYEETPSETVSLPDWFNDYMYESMAHVCFDSIDDISEFVISANTETDEYEKFVISKQTVSLEWAQKIADRIISSPVPMVKNGVEHEPHFLIYTEYYDKSCIYMDYEYLIDGTKYLIRFVYLDNFPQYSKPTEILGSVMVDSYNFEMYRNGVTIRGEKMVGDIKFQIITDKYDLGERLDDDLTLLCYDAFEFKTMSEDGVLSD